MDLSQLYALNYGQPVGQVPAGVGQFSALGGAQPPASDLSRYYQQGTQAGQDMSWMAQQGLMQPQTQPQAAAPVPGQNGGVAGNLGAGGAQMDPTAAPAGGGYTADKFSTWFQGQYGQPIDPNVMNQIGAAVGPAGENGLYSQEQWNKGQSIAQAQAQNAKPFFPEFKPPTYEGSPAFTAPEKFQAPTMDEALNDQGYQFALKGGMNALQNAQALRGTARTGGALKDLMQYGQNAAAAQYDKVYDRALNRYGQDYQIGRDVWNLNDQARMGTFDRNYKGASDAFNAQFRGKELTFDDLFKRWNTNVNTQTQLSLAD